MRTVYNFSPGPGALPDSVIRQTQEALHCVPGGHISLLGLNHRTSLFEHILEETEDNVRRLLHIPPEYHVLFLQGGSSLQFTMIPMAFLRGRTQPAEYFHTGYWSNKAIQEAAFEGPVRVVWSGTPAGFRRLPDAPEYHISPTASYFHYITNETVEGLQFDSVPECGQVPLVCDMSSDFLARSIPLERYGLIYAHAQKNLGPSGVTVVILHQDLLAKSSQGLPTMLDYRTHCEYRSNYNTPPVFAIYVVLLVTRWLLNEIGGIKIMEEINRQKAAQLYHVLDASQGFYSGRAAPKNRSLMNVTFTLPDTSVQQRFLDEATAAGFYGLQGHRSVGGIRASLYNGVTLKAVEALCHFMEAFRLQHES